MPNVTMKELLEAGVHFGHQTSRWNPKMKPYVFGARNGIYIIDLQKTVQQTREACAFAQSITAEGKRLLFVGTKKQAKDVIIEEATRSGQNFVANRWLGGTLTNYQTVKASIDRLKKIEGMKTSGDWDALTKKEQAMMTREETKLNASLGGIKDMKKLPGALFIIDPMKEHIAVKEAKKLGIPTIAVVDTNCNPDEIDYVIPGNDDAIRAIKLFSHLIAESCVEGARVFQEKLKGDERLAAQAAEEGEERKVSRFEGDIDLRGTDEAEVAAAETAAEDTETTEGTETAPPTTTQQ
jgi:small subunit ribosomal protein S2